MAIVLAPKAPLGRLRPLRTPKSSFLTNIWLYLGYTSANFHPYIGEWKKENVEQVRGTGFRVEELHVVPVHLIMVKEIYNYLHVPLGEPFKTSTMTTTLTLTAAAPGTSLGPCNYTCYTDDVIGDSLIHA